MVSSAGGVLRSGWGAAPDSGVGVGRATASSRGGVVDPIRLGSGSSMAAGSGGGVRRAVASGGLRSGRTGTGESVASVTGVREVGAVTRTIGGVS